MWHRRQRKSRASTLVPSPSTPLILSPSAPLILSPSAPLILSLSKDERSLRMYVSKDEPGARGSTGSPRAASGVVISVAALLIATAPGAQQLSVPSADAAFSSFFLARTAREAADASDRIVASEVGFDEAFFRVRQGRVYPRDVARGVVQESYRSETGEYFYTLDVPESYDPARKYQVRVQLHG